jgi:hypothetical protein
LRGSVCAMAPFAILCKRRSLTYSAAAVGAVRRYGVYATPAELKTKGCEG